MKSSSIRTIASSFVYVYVILATHRIVLTLATQSFLLREEPESVNLPRVLLLSLVYVYDMPQTYRFGGMLSLAAILAFGATSWILATKSKWMVVPIGIAFIAILLVFLHAPVLNPVGTAFYWEFLAWRFLAMACMGLAGVFTYKALRKWTVGEMR